MDFIDLTGGRALEAIKKRHVDYVVTVGQVYADSVDLLNSGHQSRRLPLGLVMGPRGSGKTFFALNELKNKFLRFDNMGNKCVTIYLFPFLANACYIQKDEKTQTEKLNDGAAFELIDWIKSQVARKIQEHFEVEKQLNMHICLIFDDAGTGQAKAWFESKSMLSALCSQAQKLATSVAVVVVGTRLMIGDSFLANNPFVFRMKPWNARDIVMLIERSKSKSKLNLMDGENILTVANALCVHPKLGALATNPHTAYYMVEAVMRCSALYARYSWSVQLDEWAPGIVSRVVEDYVENSGLKDLSRLQQRRVAASVFHALHEVKAREAKLPSLLSLESTELCVAESLLQYNLEFFDAKGSLVNDEKYAISVSPAISIILFALAGIPTTLTAGWKGEEELAALYAVRQYILECMRRFASDGCHEQLDQSLEKVYLCRLQETVDANNGKIPMNVSIPMVNIGTVMMNSNLASFADVIAPYTLIQAKTTSNSKPLAVNLYAEVEKCGLVKNHRDTRLLQGLLAMWQGKLYMNPNTLTLNEIASQLNSNRKPQGSRAYPENLQAMVPPNGRIPLAVIQVESSAEIAVGNGMKVPLPPLEGTTITFIYSTNADTLILQLGDSLATFTITEANLNDELEINLHTLNDFEKSSWIDFVTETLREGVKIKFLFTRSGC